MIHPEVDKNLFELSIRVNCAAELVLHQLRIHQLLGLRYDHGLAPQFGQIGKWLRTEGSHHLLALLRIEGIEESKLLFNGSGPGRANLLLRQKFVERWHLFSAFLLQFLLFGLPCFGRLLLQVLR